jgi:hypothetical protein
VSDRKQCNKCQQWKLLNSFSPVRGAFQPTCKACRNAAQRLRQRPQAVAEKTCGSCKRTLPAEKFWKSKNNSTGLQTECRECTSARKADLRYPVTLAEKTCRDCGLTKPASDFCLDLKRKGGLRSECRPCTSARVRASVYKLSLDSARAMCARESCDICGEAFTELRNKHIDHCHSTGAVRGVLCRGCNRLLGEAKDSARILAKAIYYLAISAEGSNKTSAEHVG